MAAGGIKYPEGLDKEIAGLLFGPKFDEKGPVSQLWLAEGGKSGRYPRLANDQRFGTRRYWIFEDGWVVWRPNDTAPVRVLKST